MRRNSEIRQVASERFDKVKGKLMLYTLVYFAIAVVLALIPEVGTTLSSLFTGVALIGYMCSIINVYNGNDAEESPISFLKHTVDLFTRYLCGSLWIALKCIVGFVVVAIGIGMVFYGFGGSIHQTITLFNTPTLLSLKDMVTNTGIYFGGVIVYLVGLIIIAIISLKYAAFQYELIHTEDRLLRARDIVDNARKHLKGHIWDWVCMVIWFSLYLIALILLAGLILVLVAAVIGNELIFFIGELALEILIILYFIPKLFVSFEEFYKDLVGSNAYATVEQPSTVVIEQSAPVQETPVQENPIQEEPDDSNPIN